VKRLKGVEVPVRSGHESARKGNSGRGNGAESNGPREIVLEHSGLPSISPDLDLAASLDF
jgi:hypothetical protein